MTGYMASKMGRPKHAPLAKADLELAGFMSLAGVPIATIAKRFGISEGTFRNHYLPSIDIFIAERHGVVVGSLFASIKDGNATSIIFYLKTQCGWREKDVDLSNETIEKIARGVSRSRELSLDEWQAMVDSERAKAKAKAA